MPHLLLFSVLACSHRDSGTPAKAGDTDTGVAPDSHPTDTDSPPEETDTGDTADSNDSDSDTNIDTAPPPCDRSLGWKYVAAGYKQTCGIHTDGCAECWGRGEEEGHPESDSGWWYHWHGEDLPPPGNYQMISMIATLSSEDDPSTPNACGILDDGTGVCWGSDEVGVNEVPAGDYSAIAVGASLAFGIKVDGSVEEWGYFSDPPDGRFVQVAYGFDYLFLRESGELFQTGPYADDDVDAPAGTFTDIGIGESDACAIKPDGSILCWDQFDPGNAEYSYMTTTAPVGTFVDVCVASTLHACALDEAGAARCWFSSGTWTAPEDESFTQLACGAWHACGLTPDNRIVCWGWDSYGETIPPT